MRLSSVRTFARACGIALLLTALVAESPRSQPAATTYDKAAFKKVFRHRTVAARGAKLHYVTGGSGPAVVLVGGWPQSWYAWRKVMPALAKSHQVFAFDLPGQGDSDLVTDYDTGAIAAYLHDALANIGVRETFLVGHDVGAWLAYAYAANYRDDVKRLVLMDAAIPGISPDAAFQLSEGSHLKIFQFFWHAVPDLPEQMTAGRERQYLSWFFRAKSARPDAIGPADLSEYTRVYSRPGYMKAGFEYYRAFFTDVAQNRRSAAVKLPMAVLALGGAQATGESLLHAMRAAADDVSGGSLPGCGHYLPEECPDEVLRAVLPFFSR